MLMMLARSAKPGPADAHKPGDAYDAEALG